MTGFSDVQMRGRAQGGCGAGGGGGRKRVFVGVVYAEKLSKVGICTM